MDRDELATERFTDQGETIYDFGDSFLVRCPHCRELASRLPNWIKSGPHRDEVLAGIDGLHTLLERQE